MLIGDLGLFHGAAHSAGKVFYLPQVPHPAIILLTKWLFHGVQGIVVKIFYSLRAFFLFKYLSFSLPREIQWKD